MEQLEKVRKGMEHCKTEDCSGCPYEDTSAPVGKFGTDELVACQPVLYSDALALINAQQERIKALEAARTPRLLTLEEVHDMAWDYCYLEEEVIKDNVLQKYCGKHRVKCITWPSIASCVLTFGDDAYGKRWRCWSAKPTDEQRRAAKWAIPDPTKEEDNANQA